MKLLQKSLLCIFLNSVPAFSQTYSDDLIRKPHQSHCLLIQKISDQNRCQEIVESIVDPKPDSPISIRPFTEECTTHECRAMETLFLERIFIRPEACDQEQGFEQLSCAAAVQALYEGVPLTLLESVLKQQRLQNTGFAKIAIDQADQKVAQYWSKPAKDWWHTQSKQDQDDLLRLRKSFPNLFRSAVLVHPKMMDPRFSEMKNTSQEIAEFRKTAVPELKQYMEEDKQAIGWELECWLTHMKMTWEDDLILKSIFGEKDADGQWNHWYDTYSMPIVQSRETVRIGETKHKLPALKVEFESRYSPWTQPFIEIISGPLHKNKGPGTNFTNQNIKRAMLLIPELIRIHKQLTIQEWLDKIQSETNSLGFTWEEGISSWTSKEFQKLDILDPQEQEEIAKSEKQNFLQNPMYFEGSGDERYCVVQANVDVFIDQFYTSPYLIQSMSYNYDYNNRKLYALALKWTNREMHRFVLEKMKLGHPAQIVNDKDPRNYVAGIMALSFYQAMIRAAMLQTHSTMQKNTIQQLVKLPITDLARLESLDAEEKWMLLELNKQFRNHTLQELTQEDQEVLGEFLNEVGSYGPRVQALKEYYDKLQDFLANWFLKDTFKTRYSKDVIDDQGNITEYGSLIDHECIPGVDGTCALPVELGKPLRAFLKEGRTGVVVETRHSEAPFNFAYFWENDPICCDRNGQYWLNTDADDRKHFHSEL